VLTLSKITKMLLRKLANVYNHIEIDPSPIRDKILEIIAHYEHKFAELELEREECYRKAADQKNCGCSATAASFFVSSVSARRPVPGQTS